MLQLVTTIHKPIASSRTSGYSTPERILVEQVIIPAVITKYLLLVKFGPEPAQNTIFNKISVVMGHTNHTYMFHIHYLIAL